MADTKFRTQNSKSIIFLLIPLSLTALYYPVFTGLIHDWSTNDNYSHGFFIPIITAYMIYSIRLELVNLNIKPKNTGILLLIAGLVLLLTGKFGSVDFFLRLSMIIVLLGVLLFIWGTSFTKKVTVPILYLIFMIPLPAIIWNKIAFPMQLFSSNLTERTLQILGVAVFREGNILQLAETTLEVIDACSGLRSLTTMFAISALIAWFSASSILKKWMIFFMAGPVAILCNTIRLVFTAILASKYGGDIAHSFLHDFSGFLTFSLGLVMLIGISKISIPK